MITIFSPNETRATESARPHPPLTDVARLSFEEFLRLGLGEVTRADVPTVIEMSPPLDCGVPLERIRDLFGETTVALFRKSKDLESPSRSQVTKIRLKEFFDEGAYNGPDDPNWFRIVVNLCNRPDDITRLLDRDFRDLFPYQQRYNSANIWINYSGQFGRSHFDELENFNLQLVGRKRFLCLVPGFRDYYTRSLLRGFGHHSLVPDFERADLNAFPRLRGPLATLREVVLHPGEMLYLPLGWWHQVHPLDHVNVNINFWLRSAKILSHPYVLADALYKAAFRNLAGLYDYQPEKAMA
jgi:hypothetical protein